MVILLTTGLAANYMDLCLPCITHVVRRLSIRPSGFAEETSDLEGLGSFHRSESFAAEDLSSQDFRKCCWD